MSNLIILDIGVIMGSQADFIFNEMVDLYPGAKEVLTAVKTAPCECSDPSCGRKSLQYVLEMAAGGDNERAAKFIDEAKEFTHCDQVRELMMKNHGEICSNSQHHNPLNGEDGIYQFTSLEEAMDFLNDVGSGPQSS